MTDPNSPSSQALSKLRDLSPDGPSARLASLLVADALARPISDLLDLPFATSALRDTLRAFTSSDAAAARVVATIEAGEKLLAAETRSLGQRLSPSLQAGARELAALPVTPPREAIEKLLDRDPLKKLLRAQVVDTLIAFGRKGASQVTDNPIARGLGGLGKLAMGQASKASKPNAFGAIASAVSGEVERQVDKRATDFADTAVEGILKGVATQISDPARAKDQAAMRIALLDGFLELTGTQIAQLGNGPAAARVAVARKALAAWANEATFEADLEALVRGALGADAQKSAGEVLAELGIKDVVMEKATAYVAKQIGAFVAGDAFATWLGELLV